MCTVKRKTANINYYAPHMKQERNPLYFELFEFMKV